jgi:eukaryotic-like serine/threonine-protein kinase
MAPAPGLRIGPYELTEKIGMGGMGQVYRARDLRLGRDVAIKFLPDSLATDRERLARFEREGGVLAALNHPNICTLYDVGPDYLVTELIDGETLHDWLGRRPSTQRCLECARQILDALAAAHRAGIVHRDLKPANIMVRFDGYVKVLDFGLAKRVDVLDSTNMTTAVVADVTVPGHVLGTVAYMSPEQVRGENLDHRSDLFAFGVVLYEMLTGKRLWPHRIAVDVLHAILHDEPPLTEVAQSAGVAFARILHRLLRKSPADRYQTAEGVVEALAASSPGSPSPVADTGRLLTRIAVLPFLFLSDVEEQRQSLSLGFADALITLLSNLEDVAVAPTSTILRCAPGTDPARVCRDLGVRYALQGNVQKSGTQWRVSLQLFDSSTERVVLAEKHDFRLESAFEVQDEIGQRVVEALHSRFSLGVATTRERYSSDPEAYGTFMAGYRESFADDAETLRSAVQHLSSSVKLDPEFALAHATLSHVAMILYFTFDPQHHWLEMAEHHCQRAVTLDPALPEAHLARAWILWSPAKNFQHAEAIAALERALAKQPNLERAHNRMSTICAHIGRLEEARIADEHARRSNPRTQTGNLDTYYFWSGDFRRAGAESEEDFAALLETRYRQERAPAYALLGYSSKPLYLGELEEAEKRMTLALRHHPEEPLLISLQGMLHARRNRRDPALECVRRALESPRSFGHTHHTYYHIACVYATLGDTDKAMEWLQQCVATGFACWPFFRLDPHLENLREDPRFTRLITDLERKYAALEIHRL